jgi:hypothetical protein
LLHLALKTFYPAAHSGELPAFNNREQWRSTRSDFARWLDAQPRGGDKNRGDDK